jgi:hypothetical protein
MMPQSLLVWTGDMGENRMVTAQGLIISGMNSWTDGPNCQAFECSGKNQTPAIV